MVVGVEDEKWKKKQKKKNESGPEKSSDRCGGGRNSVG